MEEPRDAHHAGQILNRRVTIEPPRKCRLRRAETFQRAVGNLPVRVPSARA